MCKMGIWREFFLDQLTDADVPTKIWPKKVWFRIFWFVSCVFWLFNAGYISRVNEEQFVLIFLITVFWFVQKDRENEMEHLFGKYRELFSSKR